MEKKVVIVMFRHNPQLGNYCTLTEGEVVKSTKTTVTVTNGFGERSFDMDGKELKPVKSVYGSSYYQIFSFEKAKELFDGEKFNGYRISHGKEMLTC